MASLPALRVPACAIVLNALDRLLGAELAYRRRQRSIAEVDGRPLDDGSGPVDDEAKTEALVEECQPIAPRILIHAALAHAGDLSLAHHGLNQRGLEREALGDRRRIDAQRAKPNLDLAHPLHQSTSGGQVPYNPCGG
jgi:hypothetical protein